MFLFFNIYVKIILDYYVRLYGGNMKNNISLFEIFIFMIILLLTIGYSAFSDQLTITNSVGIIRSNVEVRVTGVTSNSSGVTNLDYNTKQITNMVSIPAGSTVTYTVTARNLGNVPVAVSGVTFTSGDNNLTNLSANITDSSYVKICSNDSCINNAVKTFDITITNNGSTINDTNLDINLIFKELYTVTYNGTLIGDEVLSGGTFEYTFTSNTPSSVTVDSGSCSTPSLVGDTLTIENVTSNLVLTGSTTSGQGTWDNPFIDDASSYSYDNLPIGVTQFTNSNVPGKPKVQVESINGVNKVTKFEFTETGSITSGHAISTGVLAFDGSPFTIHAVFNTNMSNNYQPQKDFLGALVKNGDRYTGFVFVVYSKSRINIYEMNNASFGSNGYGGTSIYQFSPGNKNMAADTQYTIDITFTPSTKTMHLEVTPGNNQGGTASYDRTTSILNTLSNNAVIAIGGNGVNSSYDMDAMTIKEFSVTRG